jgi:hypothetical protein
MVSTAVLCTGLRACRTPEALGASVFGLDDVYCKLKDYALQVRVAAGNAVCGTLLGMY